MSPQKRHGPILDVGEQLGIGAAVAPDPVSHRPLEPLGVAAVGGWIDNGAMGGAAVESGEPFEPAECKSGFLLQPRQGSALLHRVHRLS